MLRKDKTPCLKSGYYKKQKPTKDALRKAPLAS